MLFSIVVCIGLIIWDITYFHHKAHISLFKQKDFYYLKEQFSYLGYHYHLTHHILLISISFLGLFSMMYVFEVETTYHAPIYFMGLICFPDIILCMITHRLEEHQFHDLTLFLPHLIALFRQHQKLYQALLESKTYVSDRFALEIEEGLKRFSQGNSIAAACKPLLTKYPHFILHHAFLCMETLEQQGGDTNDQGLDLILEDIDDWIEDTYTMKKEQLHSKNRILVLCAMSLLIAYFAKNMLHQLENGLQGNWYQYAMCFFIMCLLFTLWNAHRILRKPWIDESECIPS